MADREYLHELADRLPEKDLVAAHRWLSFLKSDYTDPLSWLLDNAPIDDEPTTPEEEAAIAEAREQIRGGETFTAEEVKRLLLNDAGAGRNLA